MLLVSTAMVVKASSAFAAAAPPGLPVCPVQDGTVAAYDIVRNGDIIGRHTVAFHVRGSELTVDVEVKASLFLLGIRVYHYEHTAAERWRNGLIVAMRTRTRDDGTAHDVDATIDDETGRWRGAHGSPKISGPLLASSLWNSETVCQTRLLDHETGDVSSVRIVSAGEDALQLHGSRVAAWRYDISGSTSGDVWSDEHGCWLRALFKPPVDGSQIDVRAR